MRILLVFGADGWLGKAILDCICKDRKFVDKIDCLILHSLFENKTYKKSVREENKSNNFEINFIYGCLTDQKTLVKIKNLLDFKKPSKLNIIHTASVIHPEKISLFKKLNYDSLKKIYKLCTSYSNFKFTYISSNSPFGFSNNLPFNENASYNPQGMYGFSKKMAEIFLMKQEGFKKDLITILRAPWFHGLNMPIRQKKFIKKVIEGKFPLVGGGENKRSIVNVIDLGEAALNLTFNNRNHRVYWVSERRSYKMKSMINIIQQSALKLDTKNKEKRFKYIPLPRGFSTIALFMDKLIQHFGFYNTIVHVLGELGQNIEVDPSLYMEEFKNHKFTSFKKSIESEIIEAINDD